MYRAFCGGILAVVLWGCGNGNGNSDGTRGNTGGNASGEYAYLAYAEATAPSGHKGSFSFDTIDGFAEYEESECEDVSSCIAELIKEPDWVEADIESEMIGYVEKGQHSPASGETVSFTWDEYGDWSVKASGVYNNQYGAEVDIEVSEYDFDGDGNDERVIDGDDFPCDAIFDEDSFADSCTDVDGNELTFEGWFDGEGVGYYLANYSDGASVEYTYELIESIEE